MFPDPKPYTYRSKPYLAFIRNHRCCVCGYDQTVPHHEPMGGGGKGVKCDDSKTVPMCIKCHGERHTVGSNFWDKHNIDVQREIIKLLTEYLHIKEI